LQSTYPFRWRIYFKQIPLSGNERPCTLEVFGIGIDDQGQETTIWQPDPVKVRIKSKYDIGISYPLSHNHNLDSSNFAPYGTFNQAGTISLSFDGTTNVPTITPDPPNNFWSAQYDPFTRPTGACTLGATLTLSGGGTQTATPSTDLQFAT
jgi:hypothetical protein